MAIRPLSRSAPVPTHRSSIYSRSSSSSSHIHNPKPMKPAIPVYPDAQKIFEANRFIDKPPRGWKERYIVIPDEPNPTLHKTKEVFSEKAKKEPLSFDAYKQKYLKTFKEYEEEFKDFYSPQKIKKGYEYYCRGVYNDYLIHLEQDSPGFIL